MRMTLVRALVMGMMLITSFASCRHVVKYKVTQEGRKVTRQFPVTLRVAPFFDQAPKASSINLTVDKQRWKTNAPEVYRQKEYARGVSRMIAEDLDKSGLFARVLPPESRETGAEYLLVGTIWDFSAMGKWRSGPENAVIFSSVLMNLPGTLLSAAACSPLKTEVVSSVILTDIRIVEMRSGKTVWTCPPLRSGGQETVRWSKADVGPLVKRANHDLQNVVTQLVNRLNSAPPFPAITP